jgi:hypothetical protein
VKNKVKSMLIILFGINGIFHKEFVLVGQTVNSEHWCGVLRRLRENVRRTTSRVLVASRPKVCFWPVPEIMDYSLCTETTTDTKLNQTKIKTETKTKTELTKPKLLN